MILGGGKISDYQFSRAWGVNPSAASGTVIISNVSGGGEEAFSIAVGDYLVFSFDSVATFYGIVSETGATASDPAQGLVQTFTVVDNRVRLGWQMVYGAWNMEDDARAKSLARASAPAAPGDSGSGGSDGVDFQGVIVSSDPVGGGGVTAPGSPGEARRQYWSILPQHEESGLKTYHDEPFTAREILNFAFAGAWGSFGFARHYHAALSGLILTGLDYTGGIKLASLVSEISDKAGLEVTINGARTLVWARKGEGLPPLPDSACNNRSTGQALTTVDTALRVTGEKVRVQVLNVPMEPDWQPGWEAFIDELAWRREVAKVFAMPTVTKADQADLSAKARQVTVYQYAKQKNAPALLDYRSFGQASRAVMSAWAYIQEIVYRSYRIPPATQIYGLPLSSVALADALLCGTDLTGEGATAKQSYARAPVEFYPAAQAQVIYQGQPLDLIDARDIRLFYRNGTRDLRNEWTTATDFEVDPLNFSIRFAVPVFVDGLPSEGKSIYLLQNQGEGGGVDLTATVEEGSDYLDIVVPNPDYEITPAAIKASFCFEFGKFRRDHGGGPRRGGLHVPGLALHVLDIQGDAAFSPAGTSSLTGSALRLPTLGTGVFREILYQDGGSALDKAAAAADSQLQLSPIQSTGGFTRHGLAGTALTGVVDRVSVSITPSGVAETVSYTKARATGVAFAEKTLARIQRSSEFYPGFDQLKTEIRQYRLIAHAERAKVSKKKPLPYHNFELIFSKPIGSAANSTSTLRDQNAAAPTRGKVAEWRAGDLVWVDGKGNPSKTGKAFAGVLVSTPTKPPGQPQTKDLVVATSGTVPVRISGSVAAGAAVLAAPGAHLAASAGGVSIGTLAHGDAVPATPDPAKEVLAMVRLGAGGGGGAVAGPCHFGELYTYAVEGSGSGSAALEAKTGIRGGGLDAIHRTWVMPPYEVDLAIPGEWIIYLRTPVVANTTPDGSATLSGIASSTAPAWVALPYDSSASTPVAVEAQVVPPIFTGGAAADGVSIAVLGILKVAGGSATFQSYGCGGIILNHCPGTLGHSRGTVSTDSSGL